VNIYVRDYMSPYSINPEASERRDEKKDATLVNKNNDLSNKYLNSKNMSWGQYD
jgi:hypothetical protein